MNQSRYLVTGDVVYGENRFGISRYVIHRTTKTLAVSEGGFKFKVKVNADGSVDKFGGYEESWKSKRYFIEDPKVKEGYEHQEICSFLKSFDFRLLRIDALRVMSAVVRGELEATEILKKIKQKS